MKRIIHWILCLLTAFVCVFSAACGKTDNGGGTTSTPGGTTEPGDNTGNNTGETGMEIYWKDKSDCGIHVTAEGVMTLGGKPLYMAGVNCYNLFNQCLQAEGTPSAQKAKTALDTLADYGVGVVRFNCGDYDYTGIDYYRKHKEESLRLLAEIADYAEEKHIGLIPSLFWLDRAVPDYFDEPIRSWGKADSKTVAFLKEYTTDVVSYLRNHKSVFGWEFGNEFNLGCDLPNAADHVPPLPPHSKREKRTAEDYLSATDAAYAFGVFAQTVATLDKSDRLVTSGNASLRPSQYNQLHNKSWEQDTEAEYAEMTAMYTPNGMNTVCEHVYFTEQTTFGRKLDLKQYLAYITATAKAQNKAYFIGEWGGDGESDIVYYRKIADDIINAGVQLSLFWNYNLTEGSIEHSFSADTARGKEVLALIKEINERYENEY